MNSKKGKFFPIITKDSKKIIFKKVKNDNMFLLNFTKKKSFYKLIIFLLIIIVIFSTLLFLK